MFFVIRISKYVGCEGTIIDAKKSAMGGQSRHFDVRRSLPVYPDERTIPEPVGMSQTCHFRTHAPQQASLFDHLIGVNEERRGDGEAEALGSL